MDKTINIHLQMNSAFNFFNQALFENKLPKCIITMRASRSVYGYYIGDRFVGRTPEDQSLVSEIAMNPDTFDREDILILATLVHEMVHLWQHKLGNPSRARYHNKEWGGKMEEIGLMPSSTGLEGGKRTGQVMSHYIIRGGQFDKCANEYLAKFQLDYKGVKEDQDKTKRPKSKVKNTCPECGINAWAKPGVNLMCGDCEAHLEPEEE